MIDPTIYLMGFALFLGGSALAVAVYSHHAHRRTLEQVIRFRVTKELLERLERESASGKKKTGKHRSA